MLYRIAEHLRIAPRSGLRQHYWLVELGFHDIGKEAKRWTLIQRHYSLARAVDFLKDNGIGIFEVIYLPKELQP